MDVNCRWIPWHIFLNYLYIFIAQCCVQRKGPNHDLIVIFVVYFKC